jgi:hypothetical protein
MKGETNWVLHMVAESRSWTISAQSILVRGKGNPEVMAPRWFRKKEPLPLTRFVDWQETGFWDA